VSEHRCLSCEDWQRRDAVNKAEIARLREEFGQAVERIAEAWLGHDANKLDEAILAARQIAREGR
jgi:hypothetical protein